MYIHSMYQLVMDLPVGLFPVPQSLAVLTELIIFIFYSDVYLRMGQFQILLMVAG